MSVIAWLTNVSLVEKMHGSVHLSLKRLKFFTKCKQLSIKFNLHIKNDFSLFNLGSTWVLSAPPDGLHLGPMNLAIRVCKTTSTCLCFSYAGLGMALYVVLFGVSRTCAAVDIVPNSRKCSKYNNHGPRNPPPPPHPHPHPHPPPPPPPPTPTPQKNTQNKDIKQSVAYPGNLQIIWTNPMYGRWLNSKATVTGDSYYRCNGWSMSEKVWKNTYKW